MGYYLFMATETPTPTMAPTTDTDATTAASSLAPTAPYVYRSAAEDAALIRAELKRHGWGARHISVRSEEYSLGSSITVTIKAAGIPLATVREIALRAEHVRRCEVTGDILGGGNRYVSVSFDRDLLASVAARFRPVLDALSVRPEGDHSLADFTVAGQTFHVARVDPWRYRCFDDGGSYVPAQTAGCIADVFARAALEAGE